MRFPRSAVALSLLAAALLAGCGETVIDDSKTEDAIEQNAERSLGKRISSVSCPSGVEVETGATFDCTLVLAGGEEETATLKILNEDADVEITAIEAGK